MSEEPRKVEIDIGSNLGCLIIVVAIIIAHVIIVIVT